MRTNTVGKVLIVLTLLTAVASAQTTSATPDAGSGTATPATTSGDLVCAPGETQYCIISTTNCSGSQKCNLRGTGWGACTLTSTSDRPCSTCGSGGTEACYTDGTYGPCQPATATNETCNLCDDNKDGVVDNVTSGIPLCTNQWCTASGASCVNGQWACTGPGQSCTTACSTPGHTDCSGSGQCVANASEACNGVDDDCNGFIDDAPSTDGNYTLTRPCSSTLNPNNCSTASELCTPSGWAGVCGNCGGTGTCETCANSSNPGDGTGACDSNCRIAVCSGPEVCNQCDDDHDPAGVKDNGLYCAPCAL